MAFDGRRFRRRKKEQVFAEGYLLDHADVVTPQFNRQDETYFLFGREDPAVDVRYDVGTMAVTLKDKYTASVLEKLITDHDPDDTTSVMEFNITQTRPVSIFANVQNETNTAYTKCYYIPGWAAGIAPPTGNPNDKADRPFTGNSGLMRTFEKAWIRTVRVASGGSMTMSPVVPVQIPETGVYAVSLKAVQDNGIDPFDMEEITVTTAMVDATGAIDDAEIQAQLQVVTEWSHAFVYVLQTGSGVYPNVGMDKLRG